MADPVLMFDDVSRTYAGEPPVHALVDCSLTIVEGEMVTITGPSGSGKSTLLHLAGLLDRPTQGTVSIGGVDVTSLSERQRTGIRGAWIGFVFQAFQLLPQRTALENVALSQLYQGRRESERLDAAAEALARVGLSGRQSTTPDRLSGGERQRVAIARAVCARPKIILCDEPTGNLDSTNSEAVLETLTGLSREGATIVIITHDESVAEVGTRRLRVLDGRVT